MKEIKKRYVLTAIGNIAKIQVKSQKVVLKTTYNGKMR